MSHEGVHSHAEDTFTDYSDFQRPGEGEGWVVRSLVGKSVSLQAEKMG